MKLATLCYIKKDNKTLMLHRTKKKNDIHQNKWNGLGGKFEQGESPEQCAIREIKEECGLVAKKMKLNGFLTFPKFKDNEDWYVFVYTITEFEGNLIECNEGELKWIENNKIFDLNLWDGDEIFLKWIEKNLFFSAKFIYENKKFINYSVKFYD